MATFDLVLLPSSSPPPSSGANRYLATPPSNQQRVFMSTYSSLQPSAPESTKTGSSAALTSGSGSRTTPVPDVATREFATASSLVRSHHFSAEPEGSTNDAQIPRPRRKSPNAPEEGDKGLSRLRKKNTKSPVTSDDTVELKPKKPRARKPKAIADTDENAPNAGSRLDTSTTFSRCTHLPPADTVGLTVEDGPVTSKTLAPKPRKPRARKSDETPAEPATKVTKKAKPSAAKKPRGKSTKTTAAISGHFENQTTNGHANASVKPQQNTISDGSIETSIWDVPKSLNRQDLPPPAQQIREHSPDQGLDLGQAVARRQEWTPVKDTCYGNGFTESDSASKQSGIAEPGPDLFINTVSSFAFAQAIDQPSVAAMGLRPSETTGITKRRRVEMIDIPHPQSGSRSISPEKGKAPKKKARTITDIVTNQYTAKPDAPDETSNFFLSRTKTTSIPLNDVTNQTKEKAPTKPARKRRVLKPSDEPSTKPKKSTTKQGTKSTKPKPIADKLLSPTSAAIRMTRQDVLFGTSSQLALDESPNMVREIQRALRESEQEADLCVTSETSSTHLVGFESVDAKRGLWAASARDEHGLLLEKQNNIRMPEPDRTQDFPLLMDESYETNDKLPVNVDALQLQHEPIQLSSDLPTPPFDTVSHVQADDADQSIANMSFEDIDDFAQPPPSNQNANSSFLDIDDFPQSTQIPEAAHTASTLALSSAAVLSGSPVKRRRRLPQTRNALSSIPPKAVGTHNTSPVELLAHILPSTPQSKSRRRFVGVDEILDSEDDEALSPIPPRGSSFTKSPPLPLAPAATSHITSFEPLETLVTVHKVPTAHLQWAVIKPEVFHKITAAIRSTPPSKDPACPSWYEKMLMYDPIPLEDFTAYVNTSTMARTWKRATQKQIKAFNKERKLNSEALLSVEDESDEALVVEKDLETWMVQGWCQEMSVCCVNLEGKGRSGVRKCLY